MSTLHLTVSGMHCGNCKAKVERALKAIPGTYAVEVDLQSGKVDVDFDGKTPSDKFVDAVRTVGYSAEVAS
jgi:copper chaperone CopZ